MKLSLAHYQLNDNDYITSIIKHLENAPSIEWEQPLGVVELLTYGHLPVVAQLARAMRDRYSKDLHTWAGLDRHALHPTPYIGIYLPQLDSAGKKIVPSMETVRKTDVANFLRMHFNKYKTPNQIYDLLTHTIKFTFLYCIMHGGAIDRVTTYPDLGSTVYMNPKSLEKGFWFETEEPAVKTKISQIVAGSHKFIAGVCSTCNGGCPDCGTLLNPYFDLEEITYRKQNGYCIKCHASSLVMVQRPMPRLKDLRSFQRHLRELGGGRLG